ncbi:MULTISPECIES: nucleotidyltransferase family protein [Dictyoglomus]|uniref:DNA polymerase beta domain protein region n=1 Tax=Dictyoglomus turgidum (strain DSM 6724 / Z-1310) TaxID=515635 RepID=B8E0C7_DICTD|nr:MULTISPECIES: nucleotidyltransferase [Dictyoglomus]ACK42572.1 DNA polymerase beta domain protein region [Dictyoglomus turgidum DSM 6724]HBU31204.1 nucleotidyltransferase [Dictyoglomus sp.]
MNKKLQNIIKTIESLKDKIKRDYKAEIVGIFGSYVRGEQKRGSDLDLLVKFYDGATLFEFVGLAIFLEEKLGIKKVDIVPYDTVKSEIRDKIFNEAIYL